MSAAQFSRPLNTPALVQSFLEVTLNYMNSDENELNNIITLITRGEIELTRIAPEDNTLHKDTFRHISYKTDKARWKLREIIVTELYKRKRIHDDHIRLGTGGSKPCSEPKKESEAYILIGLPASGKSGISNKLADATGSYILDSDYAKRKLPEYTDYNSAASLLHLESDALIFPQDIPHKPASFKPLFELCVEEKNNICVPKIGYNPESIEKLCMMLKNKYQYKIHLILAALDRKEATIRAIKRYKETSRYVPLGLIFDGYANDPILTYYRLKNSNKRNDNLFESFCAVSTNVKIGTPPVIVDIQGDNPLLKIYNN